jgi:hypothetical protein
MSGLHVKGAQVMDAGEMQLPFPSQVLCATKRLPVTSHDGCLQTVWMSYLRQKPFPSHMPSRPHVLVGSGPHDG